jgi:cell division protease FtsH
VDEEIRSILGDVYTRAKSLLVEHRQALERLVQVLLEKEQIQGEEVYALVRSEGSRSEGPLVQ